MVRRVATVLSLVSLFWGSVPPSATAVFGYWDVGLDPHDASGIADIEFSRRTVWEDANGQRWFRLKIRASEHLGSVWGGFDASIDYRRGSRRDARISFVNIDGPPYCALNLRNGNGWIFSAQQDGRSITCKFRLRLLDPTKRIRWWVRSPSLGTIDPPDVDRAPNRGWYA